MLRVHSQPVVNHSKIFLMKSDLERKALPFFPKLIVAAIFSAFASQALAVEPFTVKDIRVEGIQRTEAGTVFSYLPVRVGDTFNDEKAAAAIKALYATGFFKDVRIEVDGNVLVVMLEERPAIAGVDFTGTKEFEKAQLIKSLKELGLGEGRILDKSLVDRAEQELKRQYLSRGLYGVQITTTVTPIERNRVNVSFVVDEGDAAKIRQINVVGNKAFKQDELLDQIKLSTSGWFTWYSKNDQYSKQKLAGDLETLRSFYLNRGYLEFNVESTQVAISPDKQTISITINVNEGQPYTVTAVRLEGEYLGRESEFESLISIKPGEPYQAEAVADLHARFDGRIAVASGADMGKVRLQLEKTGLLRWFEGRTFSGHEQPRSKPHPDVYLAAAAALGVDPKRCAVVEDTVTGATAGVAAGATVFGYCPPEAGHDTAERLRAVGVRHCFTDMAELPALLG